MDADINQWAVLVHVPCRDVILSKAGRMDGNKPLLSGSNNYIDRWGELGRVSFSATFSLGKN